MKRILVSLILTISLASCLKEELPVALPRPGSLMTGSVDLMSDYRYQAYFDLNTDSMLSRNLKKEWDLGFECSETGLHVILNSSKLMFAARTQATSFAEITDTNGLYTWRFDAATGNLDSTAIGDWTVEKGIYLIDRGYDEKGRHLGMAKLAIDSMNRDFYYVRFEILNENKTNKLVIPKNSTINFAFLSFENGGEIKLLEPPKSDWDLLFTQYTERLFDGSIYVPYLVTGVLLNRSGTSWAVETVKSFDEIKLEQMLSYDFRNSINHPGYDWKQYDFDAGFYKVDPGIVYIIRVSDGIFFKLRFIDFYNESGQAGNPVFEFQRL